jgi:hypothetical protein
MSGTPVNTIVIRGQAYELKQSPDSLYYDNEPSKEGETVYLATEQLNMKCEFKVDQISKLVYLSSPIDICYCNQTSSHSILELSILDNDKPVFMLTGNGNDLIFAFIINEENQTMRFKGMIKKQ